MILIGDSHVRSYTKSLPEMGVVFASPGKFWNLRSFKNLAYICSLCFLIRLNVGRSHVYCISIGEPDARWFTYRSWSPTEQTNEIDSAEISKFGKRFRVLIHFLKFMRIRKICVIGAGTPNNITLPAVLKINQCMSSICKKTNVQFFDPNYFFQNSKTRSSYIGKNFRDKSLEDKVHLSSQIGEDFIKFSTVFEAGVRGANPFPNEGFEYIEMFECYRLKLSNGIKLINRVFKIK